MEALRTATRSRTSFYLESPKKAAISAGREFLRRLRAAIEAGEDLIVESTLSGRSMARFLELARSRLYRIVVVFIFLHRVDICVRRLRIRLRKGGHHVPEADILRRYGRSKANFWNLYRPFADEWHLYFNEASKVWENIMQATGRGWNVPTEFRIQAL